MSWHLDAEMALIAGMVGGSLIKNREAFQGVSEFVMETDDEGNYTGDILIHCRNTRTFRLSFTDEDAARGFVDARDEALAIRRSLSG